MLRNSPTSVFFSFLISGLLGCWSSTAHAQVPSPSLQSIFPAGGKQGAKFEVTVNGTDLDDATQLQFSQPGLSSEPKMTSGDNPKPIPKQFLVNVTPEVATGLYEVRVVSPYGISNPRAFQINALNEVFEKEPNNNRATANEVALNSVVNGVSDAEGIDCFRFTATKDQRILIDCWAERLDSRMDATLILYDANGNEFDRSLDVFGRDPFMDFTVPADGQYTIDLHDFLYRGGPDYFYRMSISTLPYVDFVFPCAGEAGKKSKYTLYGRNLPGGTPDNTVVVHGRTLEKIEVEIELPSDALSRQRMPVNGLIDPRDAYQDAFSYRLKTPQGESNPVNIYYATGPVVLEQEPTNSDPNTAQKLTVPCEVAGQFNPKGDRDCFEFDAKKGEVLWLEVISQRMGLTTDPTMLIQRLKKDDKGNVQVSDVAEVDDYVPEREKNQPNNIFPFATDDPVYKLTVPDDGTYRVTIKDQYGGSRGNPLMAYRFSIRPETPDFRLMAISEGPIDEKNPQQVKVGSPVVLKKGATGVKVIANRTDGFDGEISVAIEGLPEGLSCSGVVIGPKTHSAVLVISAAENTPAWSGPLKIVGRAKIKDQELVREARSAAILWNVQNPQNEQTRVRMTQVVSLGVNAQDESPVSIDLGEAKPLEVKMGDKLTIPVKVTRRGEFKGNLKLRAVGLPKEIVAAEIDIAPAAADGSFMFEAKAGTPPGTYTFFVQATSQINYRKNPKAAEKATEAQRLADKTAVDAVAAAKTAADQVAAAVKAIADADGGVKAANDQLQIKIREASEADNGIKTAGDQLQAKLKQLADADVALKNAADLIATQNKETLDADNALKSSVEQFLAKGKELSDADAALQAANEKLKVANDALAQKVDDQNLKDAQAAAQAAQAAATEVQKQRTAAKEVAEKSLAEVQTRQKQATDLKAAAEKAHADVQAQQKQLADAKTGLEQANVQAVEKQKQAAAAKTAADAAVVTAQAKQKTSADAKTNAEKIAAEAQGKQKAAEAEKVAAAQRVKDATESAKPKNVNMVFVSTPVTVTIIPK